MTWALDIALPMGGSQVTVSKRFAAVEPMGQTGARIKWPAKSRREVRVSVEPVQGDSEMAEIIRLAGQFDAEVVTSADVNDGEGRLFVLREPDPRRHIVVASRSVRRRLSTQISMEASAYNRENELTDEWAVVEASYESLKSIKQELNGCQLRLSPTNSDDRIRFDLPDDVHIAQWAYGMAQLSKAGGASIGRLAWGALAAADLDSCIAAFQALAAEDTIANPMLRHDPDEETMAFGATIVDQRDVASVLLCGARPLGRGVAVVVATLLIGDEFERDGDTMQNVMTHSLLTAKTFGRARKPRASANAADALNPIDSFRHRVRLG